MEERKPEEFPRQYQELIRIIGLDATLALCREMGGDERYIPKTDLLEAYIQQERIRREWNGVNGRYLARKYKVSVRWIRKLMEGRQPSQEAGQTQMEGL